MARIRLVHWNADEALAKLDLLTAAGHQAVYGGEYKDWRRDPVDAVVIDLSRLPSHGREVAVGLRGSKLTRQIPILFAEGDPEKVEAIRKLLPDAVYAKWTRIPAALKKIKPLTDPVVPDQMMDRYAGRTLAQKLGIKESTQVTVIEPPRDYMQILADLPPGVEVSEDPESPAAVTLCFIHNPDVLHDVLIQARRLAARTKLWVCWPKGKKTRLSENDVRDSAIALGLVDYKVCSVSTVWSGLAFALKK